jgi:hypothetical protein
MSWDKYFSDPIALSNGGMKLKSDKVCDRDKDFSR